MESLQNISDMRSRFLRNNPNVNVIRMDAYGAAVLLAKVNSSQETEQVFHAKGDEIHLPSDMLTGEGSEAIKGGSAQVGTSSGRGQQGTLRNMRPCNHDIVTLLLKRSYTVG